MDDPIRAVLQQLVELEDSYSVNGADPDTTQWDIAIDDARAVLAAEPATPSAPPTFELVEEWVSEVWHEGTPVRVAASDLHIAQRAAEWGARRGAPAPAVPDEVRKAFSELGRRQENLHRFRDLRTALAAEPPAPDPHEALAARPLLEAVARMADCIGQHTVGEITVISDRAAAWLAENPPGQPVAIEPRGCPTPGACSCVEPPAPDHIPDATEMVAAGEREELAEWLEGEACYVQEHDYTTIYSGGRLRRAAALLREPAPALVSVPVSERPWERPGWCDAEGRCWWLVPNQSWPSVYLMKVDGVLAAADEDTHCLPHWALPQPPQGGEVEE